MSNKLNPVHPGEVLLEEFIKPLNLSQNRLAIEIGVDARRINEIVLGTRSVTADTALRLARYFGVSPQFWLGLQDTILLCQQSESTVCVINIGDGVSPVPVVIPTPEPTEVP